MTSEQEKKFKAEFTNHLTAHFDRQKVGAGYYRNESTTIRRLDSLARIFNGENKKVQNCTAVCLYQNVLYVASNIDIHSRLDEQVNLLRTYINTEKVPIKNGKPRSNKDLCKLVTSLKGDVPPMPVLVAALNNVVKINNTSHLHAELCIMDHLISNNLYQPLSAVAILFGISKLCCKLCACSMHAVGLKARKHYRAIHGNFYNRWIMPMFILSDDDLLERFLGEEAYKIYQSHANLITLIPTQLGIKSNRGASASALSDSEAD